MTRYLKSPICLLILATTGFMPSMTSAEPTVSADTLWATASQTMAMTAAAARTDLDETLARKRIAVLQARMMDLSARVPQEIKEKNVEAWGPEAGLFEDYAQKRDDFLLRRLDFVKALYDYLRQYGPNSEVPARR